ANDVFGYSFDTTEAADKFAADLDSVNIDYDRDTLLNGKDVIEAVMTTQDEFYDYESIVGDSPSIGMDYL
ncbi:MAG: hypothetical protein JJV98_11595, partial [Desulfosarcina sp.]|nr:hypothetical protein [Desulfobacterales bacterium]